LSHRQAGGDARFGGRQVEQRLHQLDRRRLRCFRRHQGQNADGFGEKVARRSADRDDMGDQSDLSVGTPHGKRSIRPHRLEASPLPAATERPLWSLSAQIDLALASARGRSAVPRVRWRQEPGLGQKIAYEVVADRRTGKSSADNLKPA
jgi:hypothetical protein